MPVRFVTACYIWLLDNRQVQRIDNARTMEMHGR